MKQREPRLKCVIKARVRLDGLWGDVCIRDISSRGMLLQAKSAPPRGTYVEVYRGRHAIVARVVWSKDNRFGVQTQDRLNPGALLNEPDKSAVSYTDTLKTNPTFERRSAPRTSHDLRWNAEQNRFRAKAAEFACLAAASIVGAMFLFDAVSSTLSEPLSVASAHLLK